MKKFKHVFSPFKFGNVEVKNRIELGPACHMLTTPDGYVTREMIAYYQNLARGGAGIITIGESPIDHGYAKGHEFQLNLGDDKVINGLSVLAEAVHRYGAKLSVEINHSGRFTLVNRETIGPSPIPTDLEETLARQQNRPIFRVIEMDQQMIDDVVDGFAEAAFRCLRAGFEMVMVHGAHGHLLSQFVSPYSNKRKDSYGGTLENRARFPLEVLNAIRKKVGNKLAIEYRISANELVPGGMEEDETIEFVKMIEDKIDLLHVSAGMLGVNRTVPQIIQPTYLPHEYNVHRAEKLRKHLRVPITTVGSISDIEAAERILAEGKADMVAMVRAILADPQIVNNARRGKYEETRPCLRCFNCNKLTRHFYPIRCAVNPVLGRELEYADIPPARVKKKVVIVGGGPAGIQSALTAAQRGHDVVLYEKNDSLGGNLQLASALKIKADMHRFLGWLIKKTETTDNITVKMNTKADPKKIKAEKADTIIVAVGAEPIIGNIPGADKGNVFWVGDVDADDPRIGKSAVVIGGGSTGSEAALELAKFGKKVTVVDVLHHDVLAGEWPRGLAYQMEDHGVELLTEMKVEEITQKGVIVMNKNWEKTEIKVDSVILSLGFKPLRSVAEQFNGLALDVYSIGDCVKPLSVKEAIHSGFNVAVEI